MPEWRCVVYIKMNVIYMIYIPRTRQLSRFRKIRSCRTVLNQVIYNFAPRIKCVWHLFTFIITERYILNISHKRRVYSIQTACRQCRIPNCKLLNSQICSLRRDVVAGQLNTQERLGNAALWLTKGQMFIGNSNLKWHK